MLFTFTINITFITVLLIVQGERASSIIIHTTIAKIYRCDRDKVAMAAHDLVNSKCQTKVKPE